MRKNYLMLAASALMFAACSQDALVDEGQEIIKKGGDVAIAFGTYSNNAVKALGEAGPDGTAENSSAKKTWALENYNKTFTVWGNKNVDEGTETNPTVFFKTPVTYNESATGTDPQWVYTPLRFWDKSANFYRFFAVSPTDDAKWSTVADLSTTKMDGVTEVKFKYETYAADGKTLAQNSQPTGQGDDVFSANTDLMISNDITNWRQVDGTQKVLLEFNHILSRLNIAVKKGSNLTAEKNGGVEPIVKLTSLTVVNLKKTGKFNESNTVTHGTLALGTADRWNTTDGTVDNTGVGVAFNNQDKPSSFNGNKDAVISDAVFVKASDATAATNIISTTYNYVYQGLVIPQSVEYEGVKIDGSNKDDLEKPYLKISYTIDGEPFTSYFNLAQLFSKVALWKLDDDNTTVYKNGEYFYNGTDITTATRYLLDEVAYFDGSGYKDRFENTIYKHEGKFYKTYDSTNDSYSDEISTIKIAVNTSVGASNSAEVGVSEVTFCEGWQNNLMITINPSAIEFDAVVFQWVTKNGIEVTIQ